MFELALFEDSLGEAHGKASRVCGINTSKRDKRCGTSARSSREALPWCCETCLVPKNSVFTILEEALKTTCPVFQVRDVRYQCVAAYSQWFEPRKDYGWRRRPPADTHIHLQLDGVVACSEDNQIEFVEEARVMLK